jgi:hypothetical protein
MQKPKSGAACLHDANRVAEQPLPEPPPQRHAHWFLREAQHRALDFRALHLRALLETVEAREQALVVGVGDAVAAPQRGAQRGAVVCTGRAGVSVTALQAVCTSNGVHCCAEQAWLHAGE